MSYDNAMPATYDNNVNMQTVNQDEGIISTAYLKSMNGILRAVEMLTCVCVVICASVWETSKAMTGGGWVSFVALTSMIFTIILYIFCMFRIRDKLLNALRICITIEFFALATFAVAYLVSTIVAAVYANDHASIGAAAFFTCCATIEYGIDAFFSFKIYRNRPSKPSNQQSTQPPVGSGPGPEY